MDVNSYNKVILVGRVASDIELKTAKNVNRVFCRFQMATNEIFKDKKERTQFHHIIVWGKRAEFCERWLNKGKLINIEGKIRYRYWNDPQGVKRRITEIHVENIVLLGKREDFEVPEGEPEDESEMEEKREPGSDDPF